MAKEFPFSWYGVKTSGGPIVGQREAERRRHGVKPTVRELVEKLIKGESKCIEK